MPPSFQLRLSYQIAYNLLLLPFTHREWAEIVVPLFCHHAHLSEWPGECNSNSHSSSLHGDYRPIQWVRRKLCRPGCQRGEQAMREVTKCVVLSLIVVLKAFEGKTTLARHRYSMSASSCGSTWIAHTSAGMKSMNSWKTKYLKCTRFPRWVLSLLIRHESIKKYVVIHRRLSHQSNTSSINKSLPDMYPAATITKELRV